VTKELPDRPADHLTGEKKMAKKSKGKCDKPPGKKGGGAAGKNGNMAPPFKKKGK